MSIAYIRCETLKRSQGYHLCRKAAYNGRVKLVDSQGKTYDYSRHNPEELVYSQIFLPTVAKAEYANREYLWNKAESLEKRGDARLARELIVALPHELSEERQVEVMKQYAGSLVARYGFAVDVAIHQPGKVGDNRNYHAHLLLTSRRFDNNTGELKEKTRELDLSTRSGVEMEWMRASWAALVNRYLLPNQQIDTRSYQRQGSDRPGQVHLGKNRVGKERCTQRPDPLRMEYEAEMGFWREQEAAKRCEYLLPHAHRLGVSGVVQRDGGFFWDSDLIPALNCVELEAFLVEAIPQQQQQLEREAKVARQRAEAEANKRRVEVERQREQERQRQKITNEIVELAKLATEIIDTVDFSSGDAIKIYDSDSERMIEYSISQTTNWDLPLLNDLVIEQIRLALDKVYRECLEIAPSSCYQRGHEFYVVIDEKEYLYELDELDTEQFRWIINGLTKIKKNALEQQRRDLLLDRNMQGEIKFSRPPSPRRGRKGKPRRDLELD